MEGKASPKREFKQVRNRKQKALARSHNRLLEAIAKANNNGGVAVSRVDEGGVVRMKIVVRKQDLKQMLGMMNGKNINVTADCNYHRSSPSSVPRKHLLRCKAFVKKNRHCWSPELQSIPEE